MGSKIRITAQNADDCQEALVALRTHLAKLAKMTREYPVECRFADYRFVFTSETDIKDVIEALDKKLTAFRATAA